MRILKGVATLTVATVLSFAVAGCGGAAPQQDGASGDATTQIEQFENVSGATIHFDAANPDAEVEVTVADGEALVIMSSFTQDDAEEMTATVTQNGEECYTDYLYGGEGYSETGVDAGTYTVTINSCGQEGTVWVLAYPANQIDVMNMETEEIVDTVLSNVS